LQPPPKFIEPHLRRRVSWPFALWNAD